MDEAFFAGLQEQVAAHRALPHPFLQRLEAERLGREQLAAFAAQHPLPGRFFTRSLGAALAATPDERPRGFLSRAAGPRGGRGRP